MDLKQINKGLTEHQHERVYSADGISPTLNACGGGGLMPYIEVKNATKQGGLKIQNGGGDEHNIPDKPNQAWSCD